MEPEEDLLDLFARDPDAAYVGVKARKVAYLRDRAAFSGLRPFQVRWDDLPTQDVEEFESLLESAADERPLQKFLGDRSKLLVRAPGGGHARWVIPRKKLGSHFEIDFAIGEKSSLGFEWTVVELESPGAALFNKDGDMSKSFIMRFGRSKIGASGSNSIGDHADRSREEQGSD